MNKKFLGLILSAILLSYTQSYAQTKDEIQLCLALQSNNFSSNNEAINALDKILNVIGAAKNFVLTPCGEINNAMAASYKGVRYILYDKEFMQAINSRTNNWSNLFILAHEVGHHINGHSRDIILYAGGVLEPATLLESRKQELEADEFAGFILSKLGASLEETSEAITLISNEEDDTYSTHPNRTKRLAAISNGYSRGDKNENKSSYRYDNIENEAGKIINKYLIAIGGRDKLSKITSIETKASANVQGTVLELYSLRNNNNQFLNEMSAMGTLLSKTVFNQNNGYTVVNGQKIPLNSSEIIENKKNSYLINELYFDSSDIELIGTSRVNGEKAYEVKVNDEENIFFSVESGLKLKRVYSQLIDGKLIKGETNYLGYEDVGGIMLPRIINQVSSAVPIPGGITFTATSIKINVGTSDSDFQ